jgi:hypothetical protein
MTLFIRFRLTAFPAFFDTASPKLVPLPVSAAQKAISLYRPRRRADPSLLKTARKLVRPRRRQDLGKVRPGPWGVLFFVGDSEFMPSFGAATFEDIAAGFGFHTLHETVVIFALFVRWLKCSFHISLNKKLIFIIKIRFAI